MAGLGKAIEFIRVNGVYVFAEYSWSRLAGQVRNGLLGRKLKTRGLNIGRYSRVRGLAFLHIGNDFHAGDGLWIEAVSRYEEQEFRPRIVIGNSVRASNWVHIAATHSVEIGDHCLLGSKVIITDHGHGQYSNGHSLPLEPPAKRALDSDRKVVIGRNVWLGDGVVVMPDVTIGDGAVIGANSVVSKDVPPNTMCVGIPSKPVKVYDLDAQVWRKL